MGLPEPIHHWRTWRDSAPRPGTSQEHEGPLVSLAGMVKIPLEIEKGRCERMRVRMEHVPPRTRGDFRGSLEIPTNNEFLPGLTNSFTASGGGTKRRGLSQRPFNVHSSPVTP